MSLGGSFCRTPCRKFTNTLAVSRLAEGLCSRQSCPGACPGHLTYSSSPAGGAQLGACPVAPFRSETSSSSPASDVTVHRISSARNDSLPEDPVHMPAFAAADIYLAAGT